MGLRRNLSDARAEYFEIQGPADFAASVVAQVNLAGVTAGDALTIKANSDWLGDMGLVATVGTNGTAGSFTLRVTGIDHRGFGQYEDMSLTITGASHAIQGARAWRKITSIVMTAKNSLPTTTNVQLGVVKNAGSGARSRVGIPIDLINAGDLEKLVRVNYHIPLDAAESGSATTANPLTMSFSPIGIDLETMTMVWPVACEGADGYRCYLKPEVVKVYRGR